MENEEMMNYEDMDSEVETAEVESEDSGIGTGAAMLIGAGLTIAVAAAVKFGKKVYAKIKAKKEAKEATADDHDFVIPTDEDIARVAK